MGKPFNNEIKNIPLIIDWANSQNIESLQDFFEYEPGAPLFIVGSGGSLSACYLAANLYQCSGVMAKAITPLELYYTRHALRNSKVLFISASGKNTDILFAFEMAIKHEPKKIASICMKRDTPLTKVGRMYSICQPIEYDIPTKKDGFLATNSLVAYFVLLCKAFKLPQRTLNTNNEKLWNTKVDEFVEKVTSGHTYTVLYGGTGQSVAYDLESKFTESALGTILLTDYRNFGHGRHHWFAKRASNSAIIAIVTPSEKEIAEKTLSLIPASIPRLIIESEEASLFSNIELLVKSFTLVSAIGAMQNIDPGRPGVPSFGSKLYHLKYSSFFKIKPDGKSIENELFISRKAQVENYSKLSSEEKEFWESKLNLFLNELKSVSFGSVIFDYDGTLCSANNRFNGLTEEMASELIRLLKSNIIIGIATGRGKSVREDFQKWIPKKLWNNVILGYYNGSDIGELGDNDLPNKGLKPDDSLKKIEIIINEIKNKLPFIESELRPKQLTIKFKSKDNANRLKDLIRSIVFRPEFNTVEMLESSHSVDIIIRPKVSKLNIIKACQLKAKHNKKSLEFLCIGDRGKWPGNDFELLSSKYSLSVEEVSADPNTCWNISSVGQRNSEATIEYIKRLKVNKGNLIFI